MLTWYIDIQEERIKIRFRLDTIRDSNQEKLASVLSRRKFLPVVIFGFLQYIAKVKVHVDKT